MKDGESIVIGGLLSNDKKQTTYKVPFLHKIPFWVASYLHLKGVIERKTDLVIQITPKIIEDAYTGIAKSKEVSDYEDYVIQRHLSKDQNLDNYNEANQENQLQNIELQDKGGE